MCKGYRRNVQGMYDGRGKKVQGMNDGWTVLQKVYRYKRYRNKRYRYKRYCHKRYRLHKVLPQKV